MILQRISWKSSIPTMLAELVNSRIVVERGYWRKLDRIFRPWTPHETPSCGGLRNIWQRRWPPLRRLLPWRHLLRRLGTTTEVEAGIEVLESMNSHRGPWLCQDLTITVSRKHHTTRSKSHPLRRLRLCLRDLTDQGITAKTTKQISNQKILAIADTTCQRCTLPELRHRYRPTGLSLFTSRMTPSTRRPFPDCRRDTSPAISFCCLTYTTTRKQEHLSPFSTFTLAQNFFQTAARALHPNSGQPLSRDPCRIVLQYLL